MRTTNPLRHGDLNALVKRLKEEDMQKNDLVVHTSHLHMEDDGTIAIRDVPVQGEDLDTLLAGTGIERSDRDRATLRYDGLANAHDNISSRLDIPRAYYRRMFEQQPELLAENVNTWLGEQDKNWLVRTFKPGPDGGGNGVARAFLSDRYRAIDNFDILMSALKVIKGLGAPVSIASCNVTDTRMYVTFRADSINVPAERLLKSYRNPRTGDRDIRLMAGFTLSNSEVGRGAFYTTPRPFAPCCFNAFTWREHELKKVHLGGKLEEGLVEWSDETRLREVQLIEAQIKDTVRTFLSEDYLTKLVALMLEEGERKIEHPTECIVNVGKALGLTQDEQDEVLGYFIDSGDRRAIGLVGALTFHAQQVPDADRQFELEGAATSILGNISRFDVTSAN